MGLGCESLWSTLQVCCVCFLLPELPPVRGTPQFNPSHRSCCIPLESRHATAAAATMVAADALAKHALFTAPTHPAAVQNLLSLGIWSTLRSIFIALLVVVGVFDLVRLSTGHLREHACVPVPAWEERMLSALSMVAGISAAVAPLPAPAVHVVQHPLRLSCSVLEAAAAANCSLRWLHLWLWVSGYRCSSCALSSPQIFAIILATLHPLECCRFFPHRSIKSRAEKAPRRGNVTSALMTGRLQGLELGTPAADAHLA